MDGYFAGAGEGLEILKLLHGQTKKTTTTTQCWLYSEYTK